MNLLTALFGGTQHRLPIGNVARLLLMVFLLFCLVIRTLYQGSLFKYLQSNDNAKEPNTIEEMAQKNYTFYMIFSYGDFTKDNVFIRDRRKIVDPEVMKVLITKITDSNFSGTVMSKLSQVVYKNRENAMANEKLFKACKEIYMMIPITMFFPKNSYLVKPFNSIILRLQASGLMNFWTSLNEDMKYLNFVSTSKEPQKLTIEHLSGVFQIWIVTCVISLIAFLFEIFRRNN